MKIHEVKIVDPFFQMAWNREKTYEIRNNDRDYRVGDYLIQREYNPGTQSFLYRRIEGRIKGILYPEQLKHVKGIALNSDMVILQLEDMINFDIIHEESL